MLVRALVSAIFVLGPAASAQAVKPVVMPHPVQIRRAPAGLPKASRDAIEREYQRTLRVAGATIPAFTKYDGALTGFGRTDCDRDDACLSELAKRAEALYGLFVTLDVSLDGTVSVAGRIVRDDGLLVRAPTSASKSLAKGDFVDVASGLFSELFAKLKVSELPVTRAVAVAEPVVVKEVKAPPLNDGPIEVVTPPPPPPEPRSALPLTLVIVGGAVALVGGATTGIGGAIGLSAAAGGTTEGGVTVAPASAGPNLALGRTLTTAGIIGLGVGAATALIGLILMGTESSPKVSVLFDGNGAAFVVGSTF